MITEDEIVRDKAINSDVAEKKGNSAVFWAAIMLLSGTCTTLFAKGEFEPPRGPYRHRDRPRRRDLPQHATIHAAPSARLPRTSSPPPRACPLFLSCKSVPQSPSSPLGQTSLTPDPPPRPLFIRAQSNSTSLRRASTPARLRMTTNMIARCGAPIEHHVAPCSTM